MSLLGVFLILLIAALMLVLLSGVVLMGVGGALNTRYSHRLMVARVWLQALVLGVLALMFLAGA